MANQGVENAVKLQNQNVAKDQVCQDTSPNLAVDTEVEDEISSTPVSSTQNSTKSSEQHIEVESHPSVDRLSSPKRGPTLSTSTSSFEALDPHDPNLSHLASLMFSHTSSYLQGELSAVQEDYTLLEQMNRATIAKYADLRQITSSIGRSLDELNAKYLGLQPYLDQIDQIEDSVTKLEAAAYKLDAYSRRLEDKFKSLEKK
ncbi:Biogenesis of lysosome-related organelles complex-1 subunit 2 [Trinorchestia longiramus]|nr:Biogenesis of lysosome-related organelles complex-1 subunit 2 [Trinorchestia longiramus]